MRDVWSNSGRAPFTETGTGGLDNRKREYLGKRSIATGRLSGI